MVTVTVIRGFRDLDVHVDSKPGDTFTATEGRAKAIEAIREKFELEDDPMWVSSRTGEGVEELREAIGGALDEA